MNAFKKAAGPLLATAIVAMPLSVSAQDAETTQFENPKLAETVILMADDCGDVSTPELQTVCARRLANQTYDMASASFEAAELSILVSSSVIGENCIDNVGDIKGHEGSDSNDPVVATQALLGYVNQCLAYGYQTITDTGLGTPNIQDFIAGFSAGAEAAENSYGFSAQNLLAKVFNEDRYNMINLGSAVLSPLAFYPDGEFDNGRDQARQQIQTAYPEVFATMPPR
jgi:hypothetical protein